MTQRGQSSLQPSLLQPNLLTTLATRAVNVDIPGVVAESLGIPLDAGVQIVADQLRITSGIVFEVGGERRDGRPKIDAILTVYTGIGDIRIVVHNTRIEDLDMTQSEDWVDLLERGVFAGYIGEDPAWSLLSFYLTREGGFVVEASLTEGYPTLEIGVHLSYEGGVKIVRAIIDILVKYGL
jgi:hypothetical protein